MFAAGLPFPEPQILEFKAFCDSGNFLGNGRMRFRTAASVSNTEISEFSYPHRVPGRELSEFPLAYCWCAKANSPSFSQNSPSLAQNSASSLFRNSTWSFWKFSEISSGKSGVWPDVGTLPDLFSRVLCSFLPPLLSGRLFALFSPSKSALFCRAKGTAQSLERGSFRMDLSTKFGKELPSRNLPDFLVSNF